MSKKRTDTEPTDDNQKSKDESLDSIDMSTLTPWQKENLEYLKSHGDSPLWQKKRTENEDSDEEESTIKDLDDAQSNANEAQELESKQELIESNESKEKNAKTYESFADRLPKVKKERNKRLHRRLTLIISIFGFFILIVLYYISPLSKLGDISVVGTDSVDATKIITQSKLEKNGNLWGQFVDKSFYEKNITRRLPRIKSANISLNGLNSFKITVQENKVVAIESKDGTYHPVLENGKILTEVENGPRSGIPVFQNFSDEKVIKSLITSYNKLSEDIKNEISEIKYEPTNSNKDLVNLYMKNTNKVIVNIDQLSEKMAYYQQVASQMTEPGVIDMEIGIFSYPFEKKESNDGV